MEININITEINRKYLLGVDIEYRINHGLCSRLVNYKNGIIYIEVMFTKKWQKCYLETTEELAYSWRNSNRELANALGCKVYIVDAKLFPYKKKLYLNSGVASYNSKRGILFAEELEN